MDTFRSFDFLGGQRAPRASDGVGVRVLYRCGSCQRVWLQDGKRVILELEDTQVQALAREIVADLARLPMLTCRLCLFRAGGGAIEADEYGQGMGFGFSWECPAPHPLHALLTMFSQRWLCRLSDPSALVPDVVTRPHRMRAVLAWFEQCQFPAQSWPLAPTTIRELTRTNRPGRGQSGTATWRWNGCQFLAPCPLLEGEALLLCALATPATNAFCLPEAFAVWQALAALALRCAQEESTLQRAQDDDEAPASDEGNKERT